MDKFNRTNFYKIENVESIKERDLITNITDAFNQQADYQFYTVRESDLLRPDLISFRFFKSIFYWWIIMKANNIEDIWNDLYVGKILVIPTSDDIDRYYTKNKKK